MYDQVSKLITLAEASFNDNVIAGAIDKKLDESLYLFMGSMIYIYSGL